jgi:pimeloyl-ACP methyl ester carboxylesterase
VAIAHVNGVHLYYERLGSGEPLVLVHGSWGDHSTWGAVVPMLAERFDVVAYDRRGHSDSERPESQGSVHEDAEDLAELIETLDLAPAHIVANSFGGNITMRLAASRPELLQSIALHEPPVFALLAGDPANATLIDRTSDTIAAVVGKLSSGEHEAAARQFVEDVVFGPGSWDNELTPDLREMFIRNAPTFLDECRDPDQLGVDIDAIGSFEHPTLLSDGDQSPPAFGKTLEVLEDAFPNSERKTLVGTGHTPHMTHPEPYAEMVGGFVAQAAIG